MAVYRYLPGSFARLFFAGLLLLAVPVTLACIGCSHRQPVIADLRHLSQSVSDYTGDEPDRPMGDGRFWAAQNKLYLERHFAPWNNEKPSPDRNGIERTVAAAMINPGYAENMLPHDPLWIESIIIETDLDSFPSMCREAITLRETSVRGIPTHRPSFRAPEKAGEGFPFDYWQRSLLFANVPLRVIHATKSKEWLYVQAPFVSGWVLSRDVGVIATEDLNRLRKGKFLVPVKDKVPLYDEEGHFLFRARIGNLLPAEPAKEGGYRILAVVPAGDLKTTLRRAVVSMDDFTSFPLSPTAGNMARIADAMAGSPYGWGGLYGNRDCSAFLRDLFAGFGLWLPRNSYQQVYEGTGVTTLSHLSRREKERFIIERAVPFATLLGYPGHVMLYIGEKDGRAVVLHVTWGIRSDRCLLGEGRIIVGGMAITTLTPGEELPEVMPENLVINRIDAMRVIYSDKATDKKQGGTSQLQP